MLIRDDCTTCKLDRVACDEAHRIYEQKMVADPNYDGEIEAPCRKQLKD